MKVGDLVKIKVGSPAHHMGLGVDGYGVILQVRNPPQRAGYIYNVYWSKSSKLFQIYGIDLEVISESR